MFWTGTPNWQNISNVLNRYAELAEYLQCSEEWRRIGRISPMFWTGTPNCQNISNVLNSDAELAEYLQCSEQWRRIGRISPMFWTGKPKCRISPMFWTGTPKCRISPLLRRICTIDRLSAAFRTTDCACSVGWPTRNSARNIAHCGTASRLYTDRHIKYSLFALAFHYINKVL
jgi:GH24 family phage-related lysozyme (muramidase)